MSREWYLLWGLLIVSNLTVLTFQLWILVSCLKYLCAKIKLLDYAIRVTLYRERKAIIDRQAERFGIVARYGVLTATMMATTVLALGVTLYDGVFPPPIFKNSELLVYIVGAISYPLLLWTIKDNVDFFTKEENDEHVTPMDFSREEVKELFKVEHNIHD